MLPVFLRHVATIQQTHQYQATSELKKHLTGNEVLIHIDFGENFCCKYNEEIKPVHFGRAKHQVTLHEEALYLRDNDNVRP